MGSEMCIRDSCSHRYVPVLLQRRRCRATESLSKRIHKRMPLRRWSAIHVVHLTGKVDLVVVVIRIRRHAMESRSKWRLGKDGLRIPAMRGWDVCVGRAGDIRPHLAPKA